MRLLQALKMGFSRWSRVGFGLLLVVVLTVSFFNSQAVDPEQHYQFLDRLRRLQSIESIVKADVLKTRFGLDPNYDQLAIDGDQLRLTVIALQQHRAVIKPLEPMNLLTQFRAVETMLTLQADLIEQFKSENAVLQNSLRYFPQLAQSSLDEFAAGPDPDWRLDLQDLLKSLLIYNLNAREELKPQIEATIAHLAQLKPTQSAAVQLRLDNVLLHGRAILRLKAQVADGMATIMNLPVSQTIDQFATTYDQGQTQSLQRAGYYRWFLYGSCLSLLVFANWLYRNHDRANQLKQANANLEQVVTDRTQSLRHTLEDLQQSQVQLIQAEKMAGLGQLVAGIAHEINNPVSFIYSNIPPAMNYVTDLVGLIERYQTAYPIPPAVITAYRDEIDWDFIQDDLPRALVSMRTGADRIREIVLSLRNFSRLDEAAKKSANLNDGIESTLLLLQHRLKAQPDRVAIAIDLELGDLPTLLCYPGQINQVFMNLLVNAIDALEETQTDFPERSPSIQIRTSVVGAGVQVEITDSGAGMTPATQQKLFDPFFTTKPVGKGTGLGMSISYQIIVERHSGTICCESVLGAGTTFIIELPTI